MVRTLASFIALLAVGVFGWVVGSVYPAPDALVRAVNPQALQERAASGLGALDWAGLRSLLSAEQMEALAAGAVKEQSAAGQLIMVERVDEAAIAEVAPEGIAPAPAAAIAGFEAELKLCPGMSITNAPRADASLRMQGFKPVVDVNGVKLATFPTRGACLSSGFGPRRGRSHKGVDYHSDEGGPILAAGDGIILEKKYRDDYGNMLLIDHGGGVHTRYAHLSSFQRGLAVGAQVKAGDMLGLMGNTASYAIPIHLHYEVLLGDYNTPKASFGLTAVDPFSFPAAS